MKIRIQLPRESEARVFPVQKQDIDVIPRFYKKTGLVPVFYLTTIDANGHEEPHVLLLNAANKQIRIDKLVEVIPQCDEEKSTKASSEKVVKE